MGDLISRRALLAEYDRLHVGEPGRARKMIEDAPSVQPEKRTEERTETHACDLISRQAAIEAIAYSIELCNKALDSMTLGGRDRYAVEVERNSLLKLKDDFKLLPSAQPERTCVNCGRTANNGGWYADGRTRCPIEEHYALPKDGYCHLWEKRNVTDDDYPERREDERPES